MRKALAWCLLLALVLCACTPGTAADAPTPSDLPLTAQEVALALLDSQGDGEEYALQAGTDLEFYVNQLYGVEGASEVAVCTAGGTDPREIAVLRLPTAEEARRAGDGLETYRKGRAGDFFGYAPQASALVEKGRVVTSDVWAVLLICDDPAGAADALAGLLADGLITVVPTPATPVPTIATTPEPTLELTPEPTPEAASDPTPEPTAQPTPTPTSKPSATPEPSPTATLTPEPTATPDLVGYAPFFPPQLVDMTLYDDTPIVEAWRTGDSSGLDEKQTAILERCREIFEECITDDMTEVEKEAALYHWLTTNGKYDAAHYDPRTPQGRPDNTNPYGMLVAGYGICLGYAETFRLFMDLCGIECITVVGASYSSSEDHAWNQVKLAGEWYCADPTWDEYGTFRYFNVTSDWLRRTDHQWDYAAVPECTATRFRWNGTGELPT